MNLICITQIIMRETDDENNNAEKDDAVFNAPIDSIINKIKTKIKGEKMITKSNKKR